MLPLVSVVIPDWDGKKYLRDCIASLRYQICVDNAFTNDSAIRNAEQYHTSRRNMFVILSTIR